MIDLRVDEGNTMKRRKSILILIKEYFALELFEITTSQTSARWQRRDAQRRQRGMRIEKSVVLPCCRIPITYLGDRFRLGVYFGCTFRANWAPLSIGNGEVSHRSGRDETRWTVPSWRHCVRVTVNVVSPSAGWGVANDATGLDGTSSQFR